MLSGGNGKSDNLLNNYVALLLQAFYHTGAYDALTRLGTTTEEGSHLNIQSKTLLKKIIYLSAYLLPEVPQFAALIQLARSLALEVAESGVTVNVVSPGLIDHAHILRESQARMLPRVPLGRVGAPADVVAMVRYLLSTEASYVTGQVLTVDGGLQA